MPLLPVPEFWITQLNYIGMFALVEVFERAELRACVPVLLAAHGREAARGRVLLGVNCRDLRTLAVEPGRFAELAPELPRDLPCVAESGIDTPEQAASVAGLGYCAVLVGTALMRSGDPVAAGQALLAAGRGAQQRR